MALSKKITTIISILVGILTACGAWVVLDSHWAKAEDVKAVNTKIDKLSKRLDQKILEDRRSNIQNRIWSLEDRYENEDMPQSVIEELRILNADKKDITKKIDAVVKALQIPKF
jgi:Co/Zn/Cd efflux system component